MIHRPLILMIVAMLLTSSNAAEWQQDAGFRWSELPVPKSGRTGFQKLEPNQTGILFTNLLSDDRSITNRNLVSGSGVAAGDVDGDGLCDLFFCRLDGESKLFRNLGGWKFEDITKTAGVACAGQDSTGAAFADI